MLTALLAVAFSACSKEDEPGDYKDTPDGVSIYLNVAETLFEYDYNTGSPMPSFTPVGNGLYAGQAESAQVAYDFIANLIEDPDWDNKDLTVDLGENGEKGYLEITGTNDDLIKQGVYNEIKIRVIGYPFYTLQIITSEQATNGYGDEIVIKRVTA